MFVDDFINNHDKILTDDEERMCRQAATSPNSYCKLKAVSKEIISTNNNEQYQIAVIAIKPRKTCKISYKICWDSTANAPDGHHIKSDGNNKYFGVFFEDKDPNGKALEEMNQYFSENRCVFLYVDCIVQKQLKGIWYFQLSVLDENEKVLAIDTIMLNWDEMNHYKGMLK